MPRYAAAGISIRLVTHAVEEQTAPDAGQYYGPPAKKRLAAAEALIRDNETLPEEPMDCLQEQGDCALRFLGKNMNMPFYCTAINFGDGKRTSGGHSQHKPWELPESDASALLDGITTQSFESPSEHYQGLSLMLELDPVKSYCRTRALLFKDLKADVYFNGSLTHSTLITARKRTEPDSARLFLSGRRIDRLMEAAWLLREPGLNKETARSHPAEESPPNNRQAEDRWKNVGEALKKEVDRQGVNDTGRGSPSSDFLEHLASMPMPLAVSSMQQAHDFSFGVIDIVVSLGQGKKYPTSVGFLRKPVHLDNPHLAVRRKSPDELDSDGQSDPRASNNETHVVPIDQQKPNSDRSEQGHAVLDQRTHTPTPQLRVDSAAELDPSSDDMAALSPSKAVKRTFGFSPATAGIRTDKAARTKKISPLASHQAPRTSGPRNGDARYPGRVHGRASSRIEDAHDLLSTSAYQMDAKRSTEQSTPSFRFSVKDAFSFQPKSVTGSKLAIPHDTEDMLSLRVREELAKLGRGSLSSDTIIHRQQNPRRRSSRNSRVIIYNPYRKLARAPHSNNDTNTMRPTMFFLEPPPATMVLQDRPDNNAPKLVLKFKLPRTFSSPAKDSFSPLPALPSLPSMDIFPGLPTLPLSAMRTPVTANTNVPPRHGQIQSTNGRGKNWRRGMKKSDSRTAGWVSSPLAPNQGAAPALQTEPLSQASGHRKRRRDEVVEATMETPEAGDRDTVVAGELSTFHATFRNTRTEPSRR